MVYRALSTYFDVSSMFILMVVENSRIWYRKKHRHRPSKEIQSDQVPNFPTTEE